MKTKKVLSLIVALAMVLSLAVPAFATAGLTEEAAFLLEAGIIKGDGTGFNANQTFTNESLMILLSRLVGEEAEAATFALKPSFKDSQGRWATPYIAWAEAKGFTKGDGTGNFLPTQEVTGTRLAIFMLRALGYKVDGANSDYTWENAYDAAKAMGLVTVPANSSVKYGKVVEAVYNTLQAETKAGEVLGVKLGFMEPEVVEPVVEELKVVSVKATKANVLTATFNKAVDTANATVKVTRGNSTVTGKTVWNADKTEAVFTTDANMINGTYTVEVTVKVAGEKDVVVSGQAAVVARQVDQIVVLNKVALTGDSLPNPVAQATPQTRDIAYVYYDVLDQYGDSIRNTTNLTWTSSVGGDVTSKANRLTGEIQLQRTGQQFMFGEKIFISGVDTTTGKSVQAELTVGQPRALDQIEIAGFVKKGTSTIVKELPSGFKSNTYYMVFTAVDQNGNAYTTAIEEADLTFVSDNPLLVLKLQHELVGGKVRTLVVDGVQYGAIFVQPGMSVDRGGEANIMAISTKTGKQNVLNVKIGDSIILSKFDLLHPAGVTAEGETIEIPFQAVDQHGNAITNFAVLARQAQLNALSFNTGGQGSLVLSEKNDGTAKLEYVQGDVAWSNQNATNGISRPVSLTSIVTGGNASTLMMSITDKARPEAITAVKMDNVVVERGEIKLNLSNVAADNSFTFVDQYGRTMTRANANAFFAANNTFTAGTNFIGHTFAVRATYKGDAGVFTSGTAVNNDRKFEIKSGDTITLAANANTTATAKTGMAMQFDIVRYHTTNSDFDRALSVSPIRTEAITVVDITAVRNFTVKEISKLFVRTDRSNDATGHGLDFSKDVLTDGNATVPNQKEVSVTGTYNSHTVTVPTVYYTLASDGLTFAAGKVNGIKGLVSAVSYVSPVRQVETATVVIGTAADANVTVVVTAAGMTNSPKTVTVPVLAADDTATKIATKVRAALTADADVNAFFTVGGTDAAVVLTARTAANNDATMNISLAGSPVTAAPTSAKTTAGIAEVLAVPQQGFAWRNLYDETTARTLRKDASTNVRALITNLDAAGTPVVDTATTFVTISDAAPVATTITGPVTLTVRPTNTVINVAAIEAAAGLINTGGYVVKDQYNENFTTDKLYRALDVVEFDGGYASNNFRISRNDTGSLTIEGAERGDTFTLVIRAQGAQTTVKVTVGADTNAKIDATGNVYLNTLVPVLEAQRANSLQ